MTTHIRIPAVAPTIQMVADGLSKTFEFPFPIFSAADLDVRIGDALVTGGFTVRGAGSSDGGAITFASAPANGLRVTIRRRQVYARTTDFLDERAPTPHELNDAVDQNVAAIQELAAESALAVKRSPAADLSQPVSLTLPEPEAGKVIGWNGSANAMVNLTQVDASDMLRKSQNLADLADKAQARINLGLGSAATHADTDFATFTHGVKADSALQPSAIDTDVALTANSDGKIASQKAVKAYVDNTVAAGDAADIKKAQNLADLPDKAQARINLGLGSAATKDVGTSANQVVQLDESAKLPAVDGSAVTNLNAGNLLSGTVATGRLGSGTADASSFLRGDGTWTALSAIAGGAVFGSTQTFTSNGTFIVPSGVKAVAVMAIGGGGGGSRDGTTNGAQNGGDTLFGTYLTATGGYAAGNTTAKLPPSLDPVQCAGLGLRGQAQESSSLPFMTLTTGSYGTVGSGQVSGSSHGSIVFAICSVTPGQSVPVTVGASGAGYGSGGYPGGPGILVVRY